MKTPAVAHGRPYLAGAPAGPAAPPGRLRRALDWVRGLYEGGSSYDVGHGACRCRACWERRHDHEW